MKKKEFQNLPNTETPINADNLNEMQDNIEESCVIVSSTEPTTNEKVWIQKGKNLFDKSSYLIDSAGYIGFVIKLELGKTYTLSSNLPLTICKFAENSQYADGNVGPQQWGSFTKWTFVAGDNTNNRLNNILFLGVTADTFSTSVDDFDSYNIQVEEGTEATEYEAYIDRKINVDGEEFINQTEIEKTLEDLKGKVLWTNTDYTSEFGTQTVNIDLRNYNFIRVIYTHWGGSWSFLDGGKVPKGVMSILNHEASTSRRYNSSNEGITFENPSDNGSLLCQVPIYIIGYKYW